MSILATGFERVPSYSKSWRRLNTAGAGLTLIERVRLGSCELLPASSCSKNRSDVYRSVGLVTPLAAYYRPMSFMTSLPGEHDE